jgi:hypothetical protein
MRQVVIESPYAGDVQINEAYARKCLLWSLQHDEAPLAGHLLYTQVLNDNNLAERTLGITAHLSWIDLCEYVVVYMDRGISPGMQKAIDYAQAIGVPVMYRAIGK